MSTAGQNTQQLQQDIQHELTTANQLLRLISVELQQIKKFTSPGGEFDSTIKNNASLMTRLANLKHINIENIPPMVRKHKSTHETQNNVNEDCSTLRN